MRRLTGRRICKAGGHIYNIYERPPKVEGICDMDGSELIHRPDDSEGVIGERLAAYDRQTRPLVEYYSVRRLLSPMDAMADADTVTGSISQDSGRSESPEMIVCKSQAELEKMHRAGLVIWEVLNELRGMARPGVSTKDLDEYAERRTAERKVRPAFKHYRGYPATLCTSINSEVVHGIPSKARRPAGGRHHFARLRRRVRGLLRGRGRDGAGRGDYSRIEEAFASDQGIAGHGN